MRQVMRLLLASSKKKETKKPLTFTAQQANSTVKLSKKGTPTVSGLEYRQGTSGGWTPYTIDTVITLENVGDVVQFQNTKQTLSSSSSKYVKFVMTGLISASGNIQSMLNYIEQCKDYCYYQMFNNCSSLITAPELPSTTLAWYCYNYMFYKCSSLTTAPSLPATTLAYYCYYAMFYGCSSLTTVPLLSATTLAGYCCLSMFEDCSSLTEVPELSATTLATGCYQRMFYNCSKLNYIKVGFTNWDGSATFVWVNGVAETGTFEAPRELPVILGVSNIPENWAFPNQEYIIFTEDQSVSQYRPQTVDYTIQYLLFPKTLQPTFTIVQGELPNGLTLDSTTGVISGISTEEFVGDVKIQISCEGCESVTITLSLTLQNYPETENNLTADDSNPNYTVSQRTTYSSSYPAWKAMDGNTSTYSKTQVTSGQYDWWQIDFHKPVFLIGFTLNCNNQISCGTYLEASEDGTTWTRIDSTKIPDATTTTREYEFTTPYRYYRFICEEAYRYIVFYQVKFTYKE